MRTSFENPQTITAIRLRGLKGTLSYSPIMPRLVSQTADIHFSSEGIYDVINIALGLLVQVLNNILKSIIASECKLAKLTRTGREKRRLVFKAG